MAENLPSLSDLLIGASSDFNHVEDLQLLLRIGLNEADRPTPEACKRLVFLIELYLCQSKPWLEEVRFGLNKIKRIVGLEEEDS